MGTIRKIPNSEYFDWYPHQLEQVAESLRPFFDRGGYCILMVFDTEEEKKEFVNEYRNSRSGK